MITINSDYHGEVKCRGIHSGVAAVMSMAEVISALDGVARREFDLLALP